MIGDPMMNLHVEVEHIILKPVTEVFEAIINPDIMCNYFLSSGSGQLEEGKTITWKWEDVGAELPISVKSVNENQRSLSFLWSASGVETLVTIKLITINDTATKVKVCETGWEITEEGMQRYGQQIQGWVDMLTCMKAFLEFGINLRTGYNLLL
jgi:uncharacterized protein YndB with AHSA1/START domain